jgi:hypothetical protein
MHSWTSGLSLLSLALTSAQHGCGTAEHVMEAERTAVAPVPADLRVISSSLDLIHRCVAEA